MAKQKKSQAEKTENNDAKPMIPGEEASQEASPTTTNEDSIQEPEEAVSAVRILFRGNCPKLTPRGVGNLEYEIGIDDETDEGLLRIAKNESSGAFSTDWIGINEIREILDIMEDKAFKYIILRDLYTKKSSNNHGFLTAILKAERVVVNMPDQLTVMRLESWEPLLKKIDSLKKTDISLTDHIAIAAKKRAEDKTKRMTEKQTSKAKDIEDIDDKGSGVADT